MNIFVFTKYAKNRFFKLSSSDRERILAKLNELKNVKNPELVMRKLKHFKPATHRLRVGNFRLILSLEKYQSGFGEFLILDVGHRRNIYK
jgi:mRNA-degrading endonuclease RelE of RelBE toxin-antitoxin system